MSQRVAKRFREGFKYEPKEKKQTKVDRLMRFIRERTGVSRGVAGDIADAVVRNRELDRLALQKGWPMQDGVIEGPSGTLPISEIKAEV